MSQFIDESIDACPQVDVTYTDLSKAFDRLDHNILLTKLKRFGIDKSLLLLFHSYLSDRTQYVAYNGVKSAEYRSTSAVPQGSILGPMLFNIYVNDVVDVLDTPCLLYADDLKIYSDLRNNDNCLHLQNNLTKLNRQC